MPKIGKKYTRKSLRDAVRFVLRIGPEEYAWLGEKASQEHLSINSLLARLVDEAIRKDGDKHGA